MANARSPSVAVLVIVLIVVTVTALLGLLGAAGYRYYSNRLWADFNRSLEVGADQFQISVSPAVWTLNMALVEKLMESPLRIPSVQGLVMELDDRALIMFRQPDGTTALINAPFDTTGLVVARRNLEYEGQLLGTASIYASDRLLRQELRGSLWIAIGLVLLVDSILSLALFFSLRPLVLTPLRLLERYTESIASGDAAGSTALRQIRFHGELDGLKHSFEQMVNELAARNLELTRYREHLEELVASRTEELERTYRRLEETEFAMNHAGISIQWIDAQDGRVRYVNERACELYGYSREQLLDKPASLLTPDFAIATLHALIPALPAGEQTRMESTATTARGNTLAIETVLYLQKLDNGQASHFITFSTDISQRKAAEDALMAAKAAAEEAARTRSEFLANMSHEIRTPMNAIIGMSQLALRTHLDDKQRNYIDKVHRSAVSLLGILNDILDFSKVESGHLDIEQVDFRLDSVLDNLCNILVLRADEKNIEFLLDIAPDVPQALIGDPMRLGQILVNLAGNAVKFTERGAVVVGCRKRAEEGETLHLEFFVRDTGIGMTEDQKARLFTAFAQADSSITRRFGGTGLGLAISKRLVELLDGEIRVDSQPGVGSTFTFSVRFKRSQESTQTWGPAAGARTGDLAGSTVLVVDDSAEAREIFRDIVERLGFKVDDVETAERAIDVLRERAYDLLICDWKMPGMDGVELVRTLQCRPDLYHPSAVIMVSAYSVERLRAEAADLSLAGILAKPANPSTIQDIIVTALGQKAPAQPMAQPTAPRSSESDIRPDLAGHSVLLVEDNPINQELANELLTASGLRVTIANNGQEAIDTLARGTFDCILMDVQMPVMDGLEATRRIRRQPQWRNLPVIAMTAGAMAEERRQTIEAGMNDHITKPIDVDQMFATIAQWLQRGKPAHVPADDRKAVMDTNSLPGLDLQFGMKSVNGKLALYRKILRAYRDGSAANLDKMRAALTAQDHDTLSRLAHTLKGSSGTLGLHEVYQASGRLEKADPALPAEQRAALLDDLIEQQGIALASIEIYLAMPE